ncbi:DNA primase subunit pri2, partial [Tieghemiomyces parasiticus]
CNKIITSNHPGPGDNHGCPFRHFSKEQLITSLQQQKLGEEDIGSITELSDQGHCQLACTRHFEITHRARLPTTGASIAVERIIHPNQYYDQSVALVTKE